MSAMTGQDTTTLMRTARRALALAGAGVLATLTMAGCSAPATVDPLVTLPPATPSAPWPVPTHLADSTDAVASYVAMLENADIGEHWLLNCGPNASDDLVPQCVAKLQPVLDSVHKIEAADKAIVVPDCLASIDSQFHSVLDGWDTGYTMWILGLTHNETSNQDEAHQKIKDANTLFVKLVGQAEGIVSC